MSSLVRYSMASVLSVVIAIAFGEHDNRTQCAHCVRLLRGHVLALELAPRHWSLILPLLPTHALSPCCLPLVSSLARMNRLLNIPILWFFVRV